MKRKLALLTTTLMLLAAVMTHAASYTNPADQFMAVCTETQEHGGQEYVLTTWLDSRSAANEAGKDHERTTRGHRWTIKTRQKPESSAAALIVSSTVPISFSSRMVAITAKCEGNACDIVSVSWDEGRQSYLVQNSSGRRVKVELKNWAITETVSLEANESKYTFLKSYIHPYRANYD